MDNYRIQINGCSHEVYYFNKNQKKQTVILLHFMDGCFPAIENLAKNLSNHFSVIAYDIRGYGKSNNVNINEPITIPLLSEDLNFLIQYFNLKKPHLVGTSLGAYISLYFASRYPNSIGSLILSEGAMQPMFGELGIYKKYNLKQMQALKKKLYSIKEKEFDSIQDYYNFFKSQFETWDNSKEKWMKYSIRKKDSGKYALAASSITNKQVGDSIMELNISELYKKTNCPILALPASKEKNYNEKIEFLKKNNLDIITIPDSNHLMFLDNYQKVADNIISFIAKINWSLTK